jgi:hypothetical protein
MFIEDGTEWDPCGDSRSLTFLWARFALSNFVLSYSRARQVKRKKQCCGAGPFLCGSGSGSSLLKISAPAPTIFPIYFRKK